MNATDGASVEAVRVDLLRALVAAQIGTALPLSRFSEAEVVEQARLWDRLHALWPELHDQQDRVGWHWHQALVEEAFMRGVDRLGSGGRVSGEVLG